MLVMEKAATVDGTADMGMGPLGIGTITIDGIQIARAYLCSHIANHFVGEAKSVQQRRIRNDGDITPRKEVTPMAVFQVEKPTLITHRAIMDTF